MSLALATLVALAPVASLSEAHADINAVEKLLIAAIAAVPDHQVVPPARVRETLRDAKRRDLESCEGDAACLGDLGRVCGAAVVVSGEAAGLADGRVVYLKAVDAERGTLLGSTVLVLGARPDPAAARAAAFRLLSPVSYVGRLDLTVDVAGAEVFLDGARVGRAPLAAVPVAVGTHALRVTHPRYRDFVRFIEVRFGERTPVAAELQAYPIVGDTLYADGRAPRPFYRSPWFIAGATVGVAVTVAVIAALIPRGIDRDRDVIVKMPP